MPTPELGFDEEVAMVPFGAFATGDRGGYRAKSLQILFQPASKSLSVANSQHYTPRRDSKTQLPIQQVPARESCAATAVWQGRGAFG